MFIEKYTAFIKDTTTKKSFKLIVEENTPQDAHKKVYNRLNYYQNILKTYKLTNLTAAAPSA
jgi:hypothetical protein